MHGHDRELGQHVVPSNGARQTAASDRNLEAALNRAIQSQRYVVAVWHVLDGQIHLFREANGFPECDLSAAERLLHDDFLTLEP